MFSFVDIRLALLLSSAVLLVRGHGVSISSCISEGQLYHDKDEWKPEPCKTCVCDSGTVMCFMMLCDGLSGCSNQIIPKGECCPICLDGTLNCDMMLCGDSSGCSNPIIPVGQCCPTCPDGI